MKVSIDTSKCTGHGMCYATEPDVYEDDPDGFGVVRFDGEIPAELQTAARHGAANCPERAITVVD